MNINYKKTKFVCVDGSVFYVRSAVGREVVNLDVDDISHMAWHKSISDFKSTDRKVKSFDKKYGEINWEV